MRASNQCRLFLSLLQLLLTFISCLNTYLLFYQCNHNFILAYQQLMVLLLVTNILEPTPLLPLALSFLRFLIRVFQQLCLISKIKQGFFSCLFQLYLSFCLNTTKVGEMRCHFSIVQEEKE